MSQGEAAHGVADLTQIQRVNASSLRSFFLHLGRNPGCPWIFSFSSINPATLSDFQETIPWLEDGKIQPTIFLLSARESMVKTAWG